MSSNKTIAKNTFALYLRMIFSMLIGFYTSRVVLNVLGVADFGVYNVIGGIVGMLTILNSAMSSSSSRYITFELGRGNLNRLKTVFSMSLSIHVLIAVGVGLTAEIIGFWFIKTYLEIPPQKLDAALWVFHFSVLSTMTAIINVPYGAAIIAHEKMSIFAYFTILDMIFKLIIVYALQVIDFDKLITYAVLLLIVQLIMQTIYLIYCYRQFEEVRIGIRWDKKLFKEMTSFAGWSLFGDSAVLMFTEGLNILLNIFFGVTMNAARGIAVQVQSVVSRFVGGFQTAINPQITKSYATNDLANMHRLIYASSKYSFFLLLLLSMPVFFETKNLLSWWLKIVPDHTVNFVRIMLVISLIDCLANPLIFAAKATGNIKTYQSILGSLLLLIIPISYVALKLGFSPESVFLIHLFIAIIGQAVRILLIRPMIDLSLKDYLEKVIFKSALVFILSPILPYCLYLLVSNPIARLICVSVATILSVGLLSFFIAMDRNEKLLVSNLVRSKIGLKDEIQQKQ
jgi:O-antigen/teichoic acid export membrane protein